MKFDPSLHQRRSIRLEGYNYASEGCYFITVVTFNRNCLFGSVVNGELLLDVPGVIACDEWQRSKEIRCEIDLGDFIVMPNHIHGIIHIVDLQNQAGSSGLRVGAYGDTPLQETMGQPFHSPSKTIGAIVRGFKSAVTKRINLQRQTPGKPVWQRNYYEHIIRNERELLAISNYIQTNPNRWEQDEENQPLR